MNIGTYLVQALNKSHLTMYATHNTTILQYFGKECGQHIRITGVTRARQLLEYIYTHTHIHSVVSPTRTPTHCYKVFAQERTDRHTDRRVGKEIKVCKAHYRPSVTGDCVVVFHSISALCSTCRLQPRATERPKLKHWSTNGNGFRSPRTNNVRETLEQTAQLLCWNVAVSTLHVQHMISVQIQIVCKVVKIDTS